MKHELNLAAVSTMRKGRRSHATQRNARMHLRVWNQTWRRIFFGWSCGGGSCGQEMGGGLVASEIMVRREAYGIVGLDSQTDMFVVKGRPARQIAK